MKKYKLNAQLKIEQEKVTMYFKIMRYFHDHAVTCEPGKKEYYLDQAQYYADQMYEAYTAVLALLREQLRVEDGH